MAQQLPKKKNNNNKKNSRNKVKLMQNFEKATIGFLNLSGLNQLMSEQFWAHVLSPLKLEVQVRYCKKGLTSERFELSRFKVKI